MFQYETLLDNHCCARSRTFCDANSPGANVWLLLTVIALGIYCRFASGVNQLFNILLNRCLYKPSRVLRRLRASLI